MPRVSDKRKLINGYWNGQQARNEQEKLNHTAEVIRDSVESVEQGWEEVVEELEETLGEVLAEEEMNPESDSSDWSSNSSSDDSSSSSSESEDDGSSDESEVDAAEEDKWLEEEYDDELDNGHLDSEMTVEEMEDEILKGLIAQWLMRHREDPISGVKLLISLCCYNLTHKANHKAKTRPPAPPPPRWEDLMDTIWEKTSIRQTPEFPLPSWLTAPPLPSVTLWFSPITNIDASPVKSTTKQLGFSTITTCSEEPFIEQIPGTTPAPTPGPANTRKRKGKTASITDPYAFKRQLDDKEAKKIATVPAVTQDSPPAVSVVKTPPPNLLPAPPHPGQKKR
ncbi:hypothetical protein BDZ91DRAFT_782888 [Kalaharituber pfeilii]|nr:hypothetical protein BDZ91DRAFT_782888 [Kalaharituber pfeilii]